MPFAVIIIRDNIFPTSMPVEAAGAATKAVAAEAAEAVDPIPVAPIILATTPLNPQFDSQLSPNLRHNVQNRLHWWRQHATPEVFSYMKHGVRAQWRTMPSLRPISQVHSQVETDQALQVLLE